MRYFIISILTFIVKGSISQESEIPPKNYYTNLSIADSLFETKSYGQASMHYSKAFEAFGWKATPNDRLKAARSFALSNQVDSAFYCISKLCALRFVNHFKIIADSSFNTLKKTNLSQYESSVNCIIANKQMYEPELNLEWVNFLDTVYKRDQSIRLKQMEAVKNFGWNSDEYKNYFKEMLINDSINQIGISMFLDKNGWRGANEVGYEGNATLFLVIHHAADNKVQEKYLPLLRKAVKENKAQPQSLAIMEDRVSFAKFGYQIYGSQVMEDPVSHKMIFQPIMDEKNVDERRKAVGLQPIKEYAKMFGIEYSYSQ